MKRTKALLPACLLVLLSGCASPPPPAPSAAPVQKTDLWPKIYSDETYLSTFPSTWSEDEAVGAIKNLQNSIVDYAAGLPITELSVDPYGMRARWSWTEGSIVRSAGFIVPFDQVSSLLLEHYPFLEKENKWGLIIQLGQGSPVSVRTPSRDAAERLGKAVLVLAKARKSAVSLADPRFGAALSPLTEDQAKAAGILRSEGVIVSWIFRESPAEAAGFSPQDILTAVGGLTLRKTEDLFAAIGAAASAGAREIKISGLRRSYRAEGKTYVEIFVPLVYSLPIAQPGATK